MLGVNCATPNKQSHGRSAGKQCTDASRPDAAQHCPGVRGDSWAALESAGAVRRAAAALRKGAGHVAATGFHLPFPPQQRRPCLASLRPDATRHLPSVRGGSTAPARRTLEPSISRRKGPRSSLRPCRGGRLASAVPTQQRRPCARPPDGRAAAPSECARGQHCAGQEDAGGLHQPAEGPQNLELSRLRRRAFASSAHPSRPCVPVLRPVAVPHCSGVYRGQHSAVPERLGALHQPAEGPQNLAASRLRQWLSPAVRTQQRRACARLAAGRGAALCQRARGQHCVAVTVLELSTLRGGPPERRRPRHGGRLPWAVPTQAAPPMLGRPAAERGAALFRRARG